MTEQAVAITITGFSPRLDRPFATTLKDIFEDAEAQVTLIPSSTSSKSFQPVEVVISMVVGHAAGRYVLDPIFKWLESIAHQEWQKILQRTPLMGVNITVELKGKGLTITSDRLKDANWIAAYLDTTAKITKLINEDERFEGANYIQVNSPEIGQTKVLVYFNSQKPRYGIDASTMVVKEMG